VVNNNMLPLQPFGWFRFSRINLVMVDFHCNLHGVVNFHYEESHDVFSLLLGGLASSSPSPSLFHDTRSVATTFRIPSDSKIFT